MTTSLPSRVITTSLGPITAILLIRKRLPRSACSSSVDCNPTFGSDRTFSIKPWMVLYSIKGGTSFVAAVINTTTTTTVTIQPAIDIPCTARTEATFFIILAPLYPWHHYANNREARSGPPSASRSRMRGQQCLPTVHSPRNGCPDYYHDCPPCRNSGHRAPATRDHPASPWPAPARWHS